ncbi:ADP-glyceromanno-heptose 6-epimerase [bacterium]|nr:ADP-glyceromanno-heptose 6-epimerase [bacterium]
MAIVVTGAAGFIGSALVSYLNSKGQTNLILVDDFTKDGKSARIERFQYMQCIDREDFLSSCNFSQIEFVFHIGARTDTAEMDVDLFNKLNLDYSKAIWLRCSETNTPLIYASSAATYGDGSLGFDDEKEIDQLQPLNPYGQSKQDFDLWVEEQNDEPPFWCGLKFFNVFGPNEYHKGRMASVVFHAFNQIKASGKLKLFKSHRTDYEDGQQKRDFIYIKDLLDLIWFWYTDRTQSGLYNAGTGKAHTFLELAGAIFAAMDAEENIEFIPIPEDIRDKYQYFTEAKMDKTIKAGYEKGFTPLKDAVSDYVRNYLVKGASY